MSDVEYKIIDAINNNDLESLDVLLTTHAKNFDINFLDTNGLGFLHYAVLTCSGDLRIIDRLLIVPNIDVNLRTQHLGMTALYFALRNQRKADEALVCMIAKRLLLDPHIDVNAKPIIREHGFGDEKLYYTPFERVAEQLNYHLAMLMVNTEDFSIKQVNLSTLFNTILINYLDYRFTDSKVEAEKILHLLLRLGAGIDCEFEENLPTKNITDNCIVIANMGGERITRKTRGFENAITTTKECKAALQRGSLNYHLKFLLQSCELALNNTGNNYQSEIQQIKNLLETKIQSLKYLCLKFIAFSKQPTITNHISTLPLTLQEAITTFKPV